MAVMLLCNCWLVLLAMVVSFSSAPVLAATPYNYTIRIDCGGSSNFINEFNQSWIADRFFTGGIPTELPDPQKFTSVQEKTLRSFPITGGKKNCYVVDLSNGMYYIRMFFVYDNYDNKSHAPSFDVSVEGTVVFSWGPEAWTDDNIKYGAYSDLFASIEDDDGTVCFYSIGTDAPVIGALEIVQVDPDCYNGALKQKVLLVNYGRFTGGNDSFGAGMSNDTDFTGRAWDADTDYSRSLASKLVLTTNQAIKNANQAPDYFPSHLYQMAHTLSYQDTLEYLLPIDPKLDYMLWFHFAEIDPKVSAAKERVFDIQINDKAIFPNVDIFKAVGKFSAYDLQFTARNLTNATLSIKLVPRVGVPLICGLENYALLQRDVSTDPNDVIAMRALKKSFQVPERMGWNGDPCAPSNWDAWEGVICNLGTDNRTLIITHLDLSNQGLQGSIGVEITGLTQLLTLNFSYNIIKGTIPQGLGGNLLRVVDLSFNQLSGSIPTSLGSSNLKTVLLNGNQLEGQVPEALYSIGVTGGYVNLSDNAALCGVPSLPHCSMLWESSHLSTGAKVGITFAVAAAVLILCSVVYLIIQRKNKEDYNFGLPHQLASKSARYHLQKSRLRFDGDDTQFMRTSTKFGYSNPL